MFHLLKTTKNMGSLILKNRGKLLLGLGIMAAAGITNLIRQRLKARGDELDLEAEHRTPEEPTGFSPGRRSKRDVYHAPQIPDENLVHHKNEDMNLPIKRPKTRG